MDTTAQNAGSRRALGGSLLFLIIIAAAISLARLGDRVTFSHEDEAVYMRIAQEMLQNHDLWVPTWFGDYAFYKPPLMYWLIMICYSLFGVSEMAARLPSAISVILTSVFVYLMGKKLFDERAGLLAGLLFATAFGTVVYGHAAMMDLPLVCLITGSLLCFTYAAVDEKPSYLLAFFALMGLSCLLKGPVSAIMLVLAVIPWCIIYRRLGIFKTPLSIAGVLIVIAFNALWPLMLSFRGLFNNWLIFFIFRENAGKFSDTVSYPPYILPGYLLLYLIPWTGLFITSLIEMVRAGGHRRKEMALMLIWGASIFVVYLLPDVRHQYYVLPIIPAAALLMAGALGGGRKSEIPLYGKILTCIPLAVSVAAIPLAVRLFGPGAVTLPIVLTELLLAASCACLFIDTGRIIRISAPPVLVAAALTGMAMITFNIALPRYSLDLFPAAAQQEITGEEFAVAGFEPHIFAEKSGKRVIRVQSSYRANDFLGKGAFLVIPESLMAKFSGESEDSLMPVQVCARWKYWRRTVPFGEVTGALVKGELNGLIEDHYVVKKKQGAL